VVVFYFFFWPFVPFRGYELIVVAPFRFATRCRMCSRSSLGVALISRRVYSSFGSR
jgi:hypothetical protein